MKTKKLLPFGLLFSLSVLLISLYSCSKEAAVAPESSDASAQSKLAGASVTSLATRYTTYVIEQGNHYANGIRYLPYVGKLLSFSAIFDSSAIYNFTDPNTKYDQNTLYGFADNGQQHQQFSARFGWRWFNNELQIAAYTDNYGDSTIVQIGSVPLGVASTYRIAVVGDHYDFTLNGVTTSLPRASKTAYAGYYKLLPYFGGDAVAPRRVTIKIKDN